MSAISRTTAWCKLAVLIADGLPAPKGVIFDADGPMVEVESLDEFLRWAAAVADHRSEPHVGSSDLTIYRAGNSDWYGMKLIVSAYIKSVPVIEPEPVTEDLARVREIAAAVTE